MTTTATRLRLLWPVLLGLAVLAATAASPATAARSCALQVIDDWYDDGRIDGTYAAHCYDDAIEELPRDVRDYSSAKEDIERALQAMLRGEAAPPATTDPSPGEEPGEDVLGAGPDEETETDTTGATPNPDPPGDDGENVAAPDDASDSASSVPLPLLVLAGLALLLVAGGSAGYLIRRFQSRQIPPPTA